MENNNQSYLLPVKNVAGEIIDIANYSECVIHGPNHYFHLPENRIVVVGDDTAIYNNWNDFLSKSTIIIDQKAARETIQAHHHYRYEPTSQIIKAIGPNSFREHGVYLCEDGTVYDCSGYVQYPEENYKNNVDIVEWYDRGAKYVFALKKNGSLSLVSRYGTDEHKSLTSPDPVVERILKIKNIIKIIYFWSKLIVLKSNGEVIAFNGDEYSDDNTEELLLTDIADITDSKRGVLFAKTIHGETVIYPEKEKKYFQQFSFDKIILENSIHGKYLFPQPMETDFSSCSKVYYDNEYTYGFDDNNNVYLFRLCGEVIKRELPFTIKRILLYRRKEKHTQYVKTEFYVVADAGKTYELEINKLSKSLNPLNPLDNINNLVAITRGGYITEEGDFFSAPEGYASIKSSVP